MCYTINIFRTKEELEKRFRAKFKEQEGIEYKPNYHVSVFDNPKHPVITPIDNSVITNMRWGLIPFWVNSEQQANEIRLKTANAKAETLIEKPSFRHAIKQQRCLVLANGFYEWKKTGDKKQPYYIFLKDNQPFAMAGIYDKWLNKTTGEEIFSFSVITVEANPLMAEIHNTKKRMPAILSTKDEINWIRPNLEAGDSLKLLQPFDDKLMEAYPISNLISQKNVEKNVPELIKPINIEFNFQTLF